MILRYRDRPADAGAQPGFIDTGRIPMPWDDLDTEETARIELEVDLAARSGGGWRAVLGPAPESRTAGQPGAVLSWSLPPTSTSIAVGGPGSSARQANALDR